MSLTRHAPMQRRQPMRRASSKRARELALYRKERDAWLKEHRHCHAAAFVKGPCSPIIDVHHTRGRIGRLLRMQALWLPVCRIHHNWIHDHEEAARKLELLASPADFNTVPKPPNALSHV